MEKNGPKKMAYLLRHDRLDHVILELCLQFEILSCHQRLSDLQERLALSHL